MANSKIARDPRLAQVVAAQAQLDQAKKIYDDKVKQARTALRQAQKSHQGLVGLAQDKIDAENKRWNSPIGTFAGSKLFYSHLSNGSEDLPLAADLTTAVTTGDDGVTLSVTSGTRTLTVHGEVKDLQKARDFSDQIREVAKQAASNTAAHEKNISVLTASLNQIKSDTAQVTQAQKDLDYASAQQGPIQSASLRLSEVRSHVNPDLLKKYDQRNQRKIGWGMVVIILFILLMVMIFLYTLMAR